ncbi:hypothetical protein D3C81_1146200 [compost metagenome]
MEAVDVLGRVDGLQHRGLVDVLGQRQLHQDAVHAGVGIQLGDQRQHLGGAGLGRQAVFQRADTRLAGAQHLVAHVDVAGRVVADQHHRQARLDALGLQGDDIGGHFGEDLGGDGLAVDQLAGSCTVHRKITVLSWLRNTRCSRWYLTALDRATVSVSRPTATSASGA